MDSQFPKWRAVYYYFDKWSKNEENMNIALNSIERLQLNREPSSSLGLVDPQSNKLAPMIFKHRKIDGHKRVNGRKRHLLVDVLGRIWKTEVHAANIHDSHGGVVLLDNLKSDLPRLEKILTDESYRKTFEKAIRNLNINFEVPARKDGEKGFVVEAKRWIVKRTLAWLNYFRRIVIDYGHIHRSARSFLTLANISMIIWRIDFETI